MDIKEKENIFKASCQKIMMEEVAKLSKQIDDEIEKQIKDELEEYQEKEEFAYNKKIEKLQKDYNKEIFAKEMECKREVLNQKKIIQKDLQKEVVNLLKKFTETQEYRKFFMTKVDEVVAKVQDTSNSSLKILSKDNEKYGDEIRQKYNVNIQIIEDKYIGGCILEDNVQGLYIDNTLQNSVEEIDINRGEK